MNAPEFRDALATLIFERAKGAASLEAAKLLGMHIHPSHASVCLVEGERLRLVRVELHTGATSIVFDDSRLKRDAAR